MNLGILEPKIKESESIQEFTELQNILEFCVENGVYSYPRISKNEFEYIIPQFKPCFPYDETDLHISIENKEVKFYGYFISNHNGDYYNDSITVKSLQEFEKDLINYLEKNYLDPIIKKQVEIEENQKLNKIVEDKIAKIKVKE